MAGLAASVHELVSHLANQMLRLSAALVHPVQRRLIPCWKHMADMEPHRVLSDATTHYVAKSWPAWAEGQDVGAKFGSAWLRWD